MSSELLLLLQGGELGVHDLLGLRRSCAVHGLHQSCTTGHILNEAGNAHTVLGGNPLNAVEVLLHIVADVRILQIGLRGHSGDDAATDVLGQAVNIINESSSLWASLISIPPSM